MNDDELKAALKKLYACEAGTWTGDPDPRLRQRCRHTIRARLFDEELDFRVWFSVLLRDMYVSDTALARGAGIEDLCEFWHWFDQRMWTGKADEVTFAKAS